MHIPKYSLLSFTILFFNLEEIYFFIFFKNSENNIISVKLAKVLGYYFSSESFRISMANFLQASGQYSICHCYIATCKGCTGTSEPLCIIATSYEHNVNFLDYWNGGLLFSQEMFAIFHQLNIISISKLLHNICPEQF